MVAEGARRRRWRAAAWAVSLSVVTGAIGTQVFAGSEDDAVGQARRLAARLNEIQGLVASFTQTLESPALPSPQVESGTVYYLRPARMRWEYLEPPGKLAIADGQRTYLYLPEDHQVLVAPAPTKGDGSGLGFLLRERIDLLEEFEVSLGRRSAEGGRPLVLRPRVPQEEFEHLLLEIGESQLIRMLAIVDPLGSTVTYRFSDQRLLPDLKGSLFEFVPPDGVEVTEIAP